MDNDQYSIENMIKTFSEHEKIYERNKIEYFERTGKHLTEDNFSTCAAFSAICKEIYKLKKRLDLRGIQ